MQHSRYPSFLRRIAVVAALACSAQAGQISGIITDSSGKPLAQAAVHAIVKPLNQSTPQSFSTRTGADGTFVFANTPAGTYKVCTPTNPGYLDPCSWSSPGNSGTAANAGNTNAGTIALDAGAPVQVQVVDDSGALKKNENLLPGTHLLVGVWTPAGLFLPMTMTSQAANGTRTYQAFVPFSKTIRVSVTASGFKLGDGNNSAVPADGTLANLQVVPGAKAAPIVIHVKGLAGN